MVVHFPPSHVRDFNRGVNLGMSNNRGGPPKSPHFHGIFHHKPSIFRYPYFWKHPYTSPIGWKDFWVSTFRETPGNPAPERSQAHLRKSRVTVVRPQVRGQAQPNIFLTNIRNPKSTQIKLTSIGMFFGYTSHFGP